MTLFLRSISYFIDLSAECGEENDDIVFLRQLLYKAQELDGMQEIQCKYREECDDEDIVTGQVDHCIQKIQHGLVHDQVVDRTNDPPEKSIQRADDPMKIETVVRVVP